MKTLLFTTIICAAVILFSVPLKADDNFTSKFRKLLTYQDMTEKYLYTNEQHKYQVLVPSGFEIEDRIPELVSIESFDMRLRINVGCLDFGTGAMQPIVEPITLNGLPALKEDYYDDVALRLRRVTLHRDDEQCVALEEVAQTEQGWQELQRIRKTFQFID